MASCISGGYFANTAWSRELMAFGIRGLRGVLSPLAFVRFLASADRLALILASMEPCLKVLKLPKNSLGLFAKGVV